MRYKTFFYSKRKNEIVLFKNYIFTINKLYFYYIFNNTKLKKFSKKKEKKFVFKFYFTETIQTNSNKLNNTNK